MRQSKSNRLAEAEMNLTPLIDVIFVILIMFIVVAPLLEMDRVELANGPSLNEKSATPLQENGAVSLYVYSDNSLAFNQQPMSLEQLQKALTLSKQRNPSAIPQLYHDRHATFGTYQSVKNAVEAAGFHELNVILKPE